MSIRLSLESDPSFKGDDGFTMQEVSLSRQEDEGLARMASYQIDNNDNNNTINDSAWRRQASCRGLDPDIFYVNDPDVVPHNEVRRASREEYNARAKKAKDICHACLVREECLDYALRNKEKDGIWGGLTGSERKALLARQKLR